MLKRSICYILALFCLLGVMAGCKKEPADENSSTITDNTNTSDSGTERIDVLPDLDYDGAEVKICTWSATEEWVLDVDDLSKLTSIDYASYRHLQNVSNRLNVDFKIVKKISGSWGQHENFISAIETTAGEGVYDLVCQYSLASIYGAQRGVYYDLNQLNYFNGWEAKYWNKNLISSNTINDRIYYVTGDMTPTTVTRMGAVVFDRSLVSSYYEDGDAMLYKLVDDGNWTLETITNLTRDIYVDLNNNSTKDVGDRFGFVIAANNMVDILQYGADLSCIVVDDSETMIMNPQFTANGEKAINLVERLREMCWDYEGIYLGYTPLALQGNPAEKGNSKYFYYDALKNGNALFQTVWAHQIVSDIRSSGVDYGILPIPKFNADQTDYHTALEMTYSMFSIPVDCKDKEMVAAVMEALGSDGYTYLVPEIFEKQMKYQYSKTGDDSRMFDLLRQGIIYEPGRIFSYIDCFSLVRRAVYYDKEWTSWYMQEAGTSYEERLANIMFEFQ